jgi:septal ring factor EnvC (AmiA/AmiB activator)
MRLATVALTLIAGASVAPGASTAPAVFYAPGASTAPATSVAAAQTFAAAPAAQPSDRARTEALAQRASARLAELQKEADRLAGEARTLLGDLRKLEVERQIRAEEFRRADETAVAAESQLAAITAEIGRLEQEDRSSQPELAARLVELYKLGQARYLRLLLSTTDARRIGEAARLVGAISKRDNDRLLTHQQRLAQLTTQRAAAQARSKQLVAARAEAQRAQAATGRAVAERDALMRAIDARRDLNAQLAGELQQAQQKLQAALGAAGPAAAPAGAALPLRPFRGALPWPVEGALRRRFQSRLGPSALNGIEVAAGEGTPVAVVHDGRVAFANTFSGYGNLVIVDHGNQSFSLYGHLLEISVSQGAAVAAGDRVGTVGQTLDGQPGLYFEVRIDGRPVDPLQWLRSR